MVMATVPWSYCAARQNWWYTNTTNLACTNSIRYRKKFPQLQPLAPNLYSSAVLPASFLLASRVQWPEHTGTYQLTSLGSFCRGRGLTIARCCALLPPMATNVCSEVACVLSWVRRSSADASCSMTEESCSWSDWFLSDKNLTSDECCSLSLAASSWEVRRNITREDSTQKMYRHARQIED